MAARYVVAPAAEIPPGARKVVEAGQGRRIVVFNLGGEFFALLDRCPHQGGRLSEGKLCGLVESDEPGVFRYGRKGEILRCPWHQWEFDIRTGRSWHDPERTRVRAFPARVERGAVLREGIPAVETFPVRVEDDYVVVEA
ncbi:Rieske (2Fe-2S) protein [Caldovatus aquaticus]|uniref:Rieske (2Fe-2S) protein n=1 Tax=Caldovatus aquaticus TaxID=2865671 RepID=A0ABS7EZQ0_9PROT|nr:Rieske (2Fe-2S) protein [Caldovatus aquaticus]MBW8268842.1 Rieske (2Fe-2S) protein [Caldovatus aquaticus]